MIYFAVKILHFQPLHLHKRMKILQHMYTIPLYRGHNSCPLFSGSTVHVLCKSPTRVRVKDSLFETFADPLTPLFLGMQPSKIGQMESRCASTLKHFNHHTASTCTPFTFSAPAGIIIFCVISVF
jgi:hypothetical protein